MVRVSEKDYNLAKENTRFWSEIATHKYLFDRQAKEIEILKDLKKEEFVAHFERLFFSKEHSKRLDFELVSRTEQHVKKQQVFKENNKETHFKDVVRVEVKDSFTVFKKSMHLYPDAFKADFATKKLTPAE